MARLVSFDLVPISARPTWVDWSNNRRLFEPIGNVSPSETALIFEEDTYISLDFFQPMGPTAL